MNPDHLKIFMQGVEAWNAWRQKDRDLNPALRVGREASLCALRSILAKMILG